MKQKRNDDHIERLEKLAEANAKNSEVQTKIIAKLLERDSGGWIPPEKLEANAQRLLKSFFQSRETDSGNTGDAYRQVAENFRRFVKAATVEQAVGQLLAKTQGQLNEIVMAYICDLQGKSVAPATINLRRAFLSSLFKHAREIGISTLSIEVSRVKSETMGDTTPPALEDILRVLAELQAKGTDTALRDRAIMALLFYCGLRKSEALGLDLPDVDLKAGAVYIVGKGKRAKQKITLPDPARTALTVWLSRRPKLPGPVFMVIHSRQFGKRLDPRGLYLTVRGLGLKRPHGLRHACANAALEATGGNVEAVRCLLRHASITTTQRYLVESRDVAGDTAKKMVRFIADKSRRARSKRAPKDKRRPS